MVMVAVHRLDVHARVGHAARNLAELTGLRLVQPLHQHVALGEDADPGCLERAARGGSVGKEEVAHTCALAYEDAATFDAHARAPERLTHVGQGAGPVIEHDGEIDHDGTVASGMTRRFDRGRSGGDSALCIAYHPILFEPVERVHYDSVLYRAIRAGLAVYSPHTALDVAPGGTNDVLADALSSGG